MDFVLLLGVVTGMRTMTAIAVFCWAVWLGAIPEHGWAIWTGYLVSALIFTGFAIGEYIGDTLPNTPSRKAPGPAAARFAFGILVCCLAAYAIQEPLAGGVVAGIVGAAIGTWGGYYLRLALAKKVGRDLPVAIGESVFALALAIVAVWRLHVGIALDLQRGAF